jgi:copper resistance protein C
MLRSLLPTTVAIVTMCQSDAFASATLVSADPPAGVTVHTIPTKISLTFSERVNGHFSTIVVLDERNQRVEQGLVEAISYKSKTLSIALKPLAAGVYRVIWHAVSSDGSKSGGKYEFTVAP